MVRCVECPKFERKTRKCRAYNRTIALADIHKQISCPAHPNHKKYITPPLLQALYELDPFKSEEEMLEADEI